MWVRMSLKAPDDGDWVALVNVTPDGESSLIGYIDLAELESLVAASATLASAYKNWLSQ